MCSASHHNQQPSLPMASAFLSSVLPLGSSSPWMAARALRVVWIRRTGFNGSCTALLSSPYSASMLRHVLHKGSQPKFHWRPGSGAHLGGLDLLHIFRSSLDQAAFLRLIFRGAVVATVVSLAPRVAWSLCQNCRRSPLRGFEPAALSSAVLFPGALVPRTTIQRR